MCDIKQEFARMMAELQKIARKMKLAQSKFIDAARTKDRKQAEEARLEYVVLQDRLFEIYWNAYGFSKATFDIMISPGSDHIH